jgi:uncharacterized delta-60 repeat protein
MYPIRGMNSVREPRGWKRRAARPRVEVLEGRELLSLPPGALDPTFGTGGGVIAPPGPGISSSQLNGVAVQKNGEIVAVGAVVDGTGFHWGVARYNTNGSLDQRFGTNGLATTNFVPPRGRPHPVAAESVVIQSDGKIVVGGFGTSSSSPGIAAVVRYNANGSLDTTFGTGGIGLFPQVPIQTITSLALDGTKYVFTGTATPNTPGFTVVRLNTNGSLDSTFGTNGVAHAQFSTGSVDRSNAVVVETDGTIVLGGGTSPTGSRSLGLAALMAFSATGAVTHKISTNFGYAPPGWLENDGFSALAIQSDGKIVATGGAGAIYYTSSGVPIPYGIGAAALARYNTNFSLDTSFGTGGKVTNPNYEGVTAVAIQSDGKIMTLGGVRYNTNGGLDKTFVADVRRTFSNRVLVRAVTIQPTDGKIVLVGFGPYSSSVLSSFALVRLIR